MENELFNFFCCFLNAFCLDRERQDHPWFIWLDSKIYHPGTSLISETMKGYVLNPYHSNISFLLTFLFWVLLRHSYFVFLAFWTLSVGFTLANCAYLAMNIGHFKTVTRHPIVYQSSNNNILHMYTRENHIQMKTKMNRNHVWEQNI